MPQLKTLAEAIAAYEAQATALTSAQADLAAAEALAEEAGQMQATAEAALATSKEAETQAKEKLTAAETKLSAETKRANDAEASVATLTAEAKTAETRAAEICAAAGVEPIASDPKEEPGNVGSLLEQYHAITEPAARAEFLEANKAALYKESSRSK